MDGPELDEEDVGDALDAIGVELGDGLKRDEVEAPIRSEDDENVGGLGDAGEGEVEIALNPDSEGAYKIKEVHYNITNESI